MAKIGYYSVYRGLGNNLFYQLKGKCCIDEYHTVVSPIFFLSYEGFLGF